MSIETAFLVCAGLGTRMKPLTDTCPKPLLPLAGRPILDYIFEHLRETNVNKVTVNTHHLPQQISTYLQSIEDFALTESYEPILLETGGGLVNALSSLGDKPFFMINGDAFWVDDKGHSTLNECEEQFDETEMDILLCLTPVSRMKLTEGVGDYDILPDGRLRRNHKKMGTHMFTGIRILNPYIMKEFTGDKFSFLVNMDETEKNGRLYGFIMNGDWHHISTPDDLKKVEEFIINQE
jgi:MurNAc alpha-1-phosphate uridylyltransferase